MRSIFWQISQQRNEKIEDMKTTITGIRSGGQSGVDRAAELQETPEAEPWQRTLWNMRDAQAILTIMPEGSEESKGTQLGVQEGIELGKPMFTAHGVEDAAEIAAWLQSLEMAGPNGIELCVGGPRASECPDGYQVTLEILEKVKELQNILGAIP